MVVFPSLSEVKFDFEKGRNMGHKADLTKGMEKELQKIVQKLKENYDPEKIILFGSVAGRTASEGSDIDLIIIKRTDENPWKRLAEVDRFIDHTVPVDILVYTPEEVEERLRLHDFFLKDALENGKVIYEK